MQKFQSHLKTPLGIGLRAPKLLQAGEEGQRRAKAHPPGLEGWVDGYTT